jgi:starch phosphorylase
VRLENLRVSSGAAHHEIEVEVYLADLDPMAVRVELYADAINGAEPDRVEMTAVQSPQITPGRCIYRATVASMRPASDYTARVIPQHPGTAVPLECARILWQR